MVDRRFNYPADIRDKCALKVIDKLKAGGFIVIDNANWFLPSMSLSPNSKAIKQGASSQEWESFLESVSNWRKIWTTNGVTDTAIFFKI